MRFFDSHPLAHFHFLEQGRAELFFAVLACLFCLTVWFFAKGRTTLAGREQWSGPMVWVIGALALVLVITSPNSRPLLIGIGAGFMIALIAATLAGLPAAAGIIAFARKPSEGAHVFYRVSQIGTIVLVIVAGVLVAYSIDRPHPDLRGGQLTRTLGNGFTTWCLLRPGETFEVSSPEPFGLMLVSGEADRTDTMWCRTDWARSIEYGKPWPYWREALEVLKKEPVFERLDRAGWANTKQVVATGYYYFKGKAPSYQQDRNDQRAADFPGNLVLLNERALQLFRLMVPISNDRKSLKLFYVLTDPKTQFDIEIARGDTLKIETDTPLELLGDRGESYTIDPGFWECGLSKLLPGEAFPGQLFYLRGNRGESLRYALVGHKSGQAVTVSGFGRHTARTRVRMASFGLFLPLVLLVTFLGYDLLSYGRRNPRLAPTNRGGKLLMSDPQNESSPKPDSQQLQQEIQNLQVEANSLQEYINQALEPRSGLDHWRAVREGKRVRERLDSLSRDLEAMGRVYQQASALTKNRNELNTGEIDSRFLPEREQLRQQVEMLKLKLEQAELSKKISEIENPPKKAEQPRSESREQREQRERVEIEKEAARKRVLWEQEEARIREKGTTDPDDIATYRERFYRENGWLK